MEEIIKEVENKGIERVVAEVKEVEAKPKKPRSQAQKEAFEKARQKRAENLAKKKQEEEEDWGESEEEVIQPKKEVKVIKPPPAKRGRPRKVMRNQEPPYQSFVPPPDPQLYTQHYPIQGQPFPWSYWGMPQQQQQQPVVNNYYYGEQHHHQPPQAKKEIEETPKQPLPVYEPEPSPENSGDEYDYEDVVMPQSQLKYRFA